MTARGRAAAVVAGGSAVFVTAGIVVVLLLVAMIRLVGQVVTDPRITGTTSTSVAGGSAGSSTLHVSTTQAATAANTTETVLWSYTLPANTLSTNGQVLILRAYGLNGATANAKNYRVRVGGLGGTQVLARSSSGNATGWEIEVRMIRTGAATQLLLPKSDTGIGGTVSVLPANGTFDLSTPLELVVTGQNGTAAANDIVFRAAILEVQ